jgi:hypothetical protein
LSPACAAVFEQWAARPVAIRRCMRTTIPIVFQSRKIFTRDSLSQTIAIRQNVAFSGLFLMADLAIRVARIEQRQADASDATRRVAVMQEMFATGHVDWQAVDASKAPGETLRRACAGMPGLAPNAGG